MLVAALLAGCAFFLPQEVPLEWYPLNNPGSDINYLELSCAADVNGEVQIRYDLALDGHRPIDTITIPISPTGQTYTYTFPLPDAPIVEMHVLPPANGALTIRQMRIINRRNEEIRRFTRDLFRVENDIAAIEALPDGWCIRSAAGAKSPSTRIELFSVISPVGRDHRNLLRCLLSTGYLAGMLWILLLAILFATYRPRDWRDLLLHAGFMAGLALLFAPVGNRGLIRNSIQYARYVAAIPPPGLKLEVDVASTFRVPAQLFWDSGKGLSEEASQRVAYEPHDGLQTLRFNLPSAPLRQIRLDPGDSAGSWHVYGLRVVDQGQRTKLVLPLDSLIAVQQLDRIAGGPDELQLTTPAGAKDPITVFTPSAVERINRVLAVGPAP